MEFGNKKLRDKAEIIDLKLACKKVGKLYPVLLDRGGNIIDGQHRLAADAEWPKLQLIHIGSEKERILARLLSNVCRRVVSADEKREMLENLGRIYVQEGERPGKLALRIAEETGMTYRWVMKYLPQQMKSRPGWGGPAHHTNCDSSAERKDRREVERHSTAKFMR